MKFSTLFGVLLVMLVGAELSVQDSCWIYGNCDPGPNCQNPFDPLIGRNKCLDCCDGGYFTWDKDDDVKEDCRNGSDGWYRHSSRKSQESGEVSQCLRPKQSCSSHLECCSGTCKAGKCWDERCD